SPRPRGSPRTTPPSSRRTGSTSCASGSTGHTLEPRPGVVNPRYVASLQRTVRILARRGIWSVLDLHQDGYGPAVHGDGAPGWATLTDGLPNPDLGFGANYLGNTAVNRAFDNLWSDARGPGGMGLQARYAEMLASLAHAFRR